MAGKNSPFPRWLVILLGVFLLGLFVIRFQVAVNKFVDIDEYAHLHAAWLWAKGEAPYQDFFYFYSPVFIFFLRPVLLLGESKTTLLAARALMWLVATASIGLTFLLGKSLRNTLMGVLAVIILAILPVGVEKSMEIRPDNLAVFFFLFGLLLAVYGLRQESARKLVASGALMGLAMITILKMAFGVLGLGIAFFLLFLKEPRRIVRLVFWWGMGFASAFLALGLTLFTLGVFSEGVYSIFTLPREVFSVYGWYYYGPRLGFTPNMFLHGEPGPGVPWLVNILLWAIAFSWLAVLGVARGFAKAKEHERLIFFIGPPLVFFAFAILAVYNFTLMQYFLPLAPLVALGSADFLATVLTWLRQRFSLAAYAGLALILAALGFTFFQAARIKIAWGNEPGLGPFINIMEISNPTDTVFDMTGKYLFRPDAYFVCCALFPDFRNELSRPLPNLVDSLIASQNKFVIGGGRLLTLPPEERQFIEANYLPLDVLRGEAVEPGYTAANDKILVAGKRIAVSDAAEFFLIAEGPYQIFWKPESISQISLDGRLIGPGSYQLSGGEHRVSTQETAAVTIIYDYERAKKIE